MGKKYALNTGSSTLHIIGLCSHTKYPNPQWVYFETEEEAYHFAGKYIKPCKLCERKKEQQVSKQKD